MPLFIWSETLLRNLGLMFVAVGNLTPEFLIAVLLGDLAEVVTHRGKRQAVGEVARMKSNQLEEIAPKLNARAVADAERHHDPVKRTQVSHQRGLSRFDAVLVKPREAIESTKVKASVKVKPLLHLNGRNSPMSCTAGLT